MSDGDFGADKATPDVTSDHPRTLGVDRDDVGLTGTTTGSRGAAPWERFGVHSQRVAVAHRWSPPPPIEPVADAEDSEPRGCHTDGGLTVAELIAKMGGPTAVRPSRHHAVPDPEPPDPDADQPSDEQDDGYDAYELSASPVYAVTVPDAEDGHREAPIVAAAEQTTVLPKTPGRTRPARIVDDPAADEILERKPKRRRNAMMLAGR
jgi:hypothetical protein